MKKKLFDIALESDNSLVNKRILNEDGSKVLGYILKHGPVSPNKLKNKIALEELVEEGLVTEAVVNDPEDESVVVATPEGKELYNKILYQDNEERPLSEILEKAEDEDVITEDREVSTEGFKD